MGSGLMRLAAWQFAVGILVVLSAWVLAGEAAGRSAAIGAFSVWLPNAAFAVYLAMRARLGTPSAVGFLVGEFVKIAAVAVLLFAFVRHAGVQSWPALIVGLIVTLQANIAVAGFLRKI